jgi:hypothetical protein
LEIHTSIIEKKMFGGGQGEELIVRVGIANDDKASSQPFVRPFLIHSGKRMAGWMLWHPKV